MAKSTLAERRAARALDEKIGSIYQRIGNGVQINMMDIPTIYRVAEEKAAAGGTDQEIEAAMQELLNKIRKN